MKRIRASLFLAALATATHAHAIRCQGSGGTLYTQDAVCPAGYSIVSSLPNGSVSTLGKSDDIRQQEQEYLTSSATARARTATRDSTSNADTTPGGPRSTLCEALADQYTSIDATMAQPNGPNTVGTLDKLQRNVRAEQSRNGC